MAIFNSHLYGLSAYKPPLEGRDPKCHTLLDFNERTIPISEPVKQALIDYISDDRLQTYPSYGDIIERLAVYTGVPSKNIMITNGSDQGIELAFRAASQPGGEAIIPAPTFAMYRQCALVENMAMIEPQFTMAGGFPVAEVLAAITKNTRIICIANPNNPSGTPVVREAIITILEAAPEACVLVDECYFEYSQATVVDLVNTYNNLLVTRTFSKTWGIPSLRFGYLLSSPENVKALLNVRGPYDINQLAVVAVRAALDNPQYTKDYVNQVMTISKPAVEQFFDAEQIPYWPSTGNYLWVFPDNPDAMKRALGAAGILVRPKTDLEGKVGLRITLGSWEQTQMLLETLKQFLRRQ